MKAASLMLLVSAMVLVVSESSADNGAGRYRFNAMQFRVGENTYAELQKAPEKAARRSNPLENDAEALAAGRFLFEDHCSECHGDDAKGGRKGPNLRVAEVQNATPGTLFWLLTNGVVRKKMPSWSKLPELQRWQLVRFLKSRAVESVAPAESADKP